MQKLITGYSLLEFLAKAQEAILEGYRFNFDDNDSVPQKFGNVYEAMMQLEESAEPEPELKVEPLANDDLVIDNFKVESPASTKGKKKA